MSSLTSAAAAPGNGGFPEPPPGVVVVAETAHEECGATTEVRLPAHLPIAVVRHVVCDGCGQEYDVTSVTEAELFEPKPERAPRAKVMRMPALAPAGAGGHGGLRPAVPSMPSLPSLSVPAWLRDPNSWGWRYLSIPVAAAAVIVGLLLLQGSDHTSTPFAGNVPAATRSADSAAATQKNSPAISGEHDSASFVRESSFSLALPEGWRRTDPGAGATFAATSSDGDAQATLWVERDPGLAFSEFEARSLDQLEALAGSAPVVDRVAAPTPEGTVVRLAADAPEGASSYEVTLRVAGPYRYYLSTEVQPDASATAAEGAELIHGSFAPAGSEAGGKG